MRYRRASFPMTEQPLFRATPPPPAGLAPDPLSSLSTPRRASAYGSRFAVAADHPTVALVAMNVLQDGASAADAVVAASAACVVTTPYRTHLGGDAFALIWRRRTDTVECLNAGGRAPLRATLDLFPNGMPARGAAAATVPGLVDAWVQLHERHGSKALEHILAPAIELAERGFPVSAHLAGAMRMLEALPAGEANDATRDAFLVDGTRAYSTGETLRQPEVAEALRRIAAGGRDGFYAGPAARAIVDAMSADTMSASGGLITEEDLAQPAAHWHEPLAISYAGCTIYEQALPTQGIILLEALNIVEQFPLDGWGLASPEAVHVMVEALKLAFADARASAADPAAVSVDVDRFISKEHAKTLASQIDLERAATYTPAVLPSDTTSFVVADEHTAIAFIQSIYWPWGSGFAVPGAGVLMNNRMLCFDNDPAHPNSLAPGKHAVHTLNNFLAVRDGRLIAGGGTPGGDNQVQVNLQVLVAVLQWNLGLQAAIDVPHFVLRPDGALGLEGRLPDATIQALETRGHQIKRLPAWDTTLARSQLLASGRDGGWAAASDLRGAGVALAI